MNAYLHELALTAIIYRADKFLIIRRSPNKKRFPSKWVVPGGKLETNDYINSPKNSEHYWYEVVEKVIKREVFEETGLEIGNIDYVASLATIHNGHTPSLVLSFMAEYQSGEVILQQDEANQFAWVTKEEAKNYDLIDGIYEEILLAASLRQGNRSMWSDIRWN